MKKLKINDRGFSVVEGLLMLVIIGLIAFVGWYVYDAKNKTDDNLKVSDSTATPSVTPKEKLTETYNDSFGNFSVKYPKSWKLESKPVTDHGSDSTITSPKGTVLHVYADEGGRGGDCEPNPIDKPFAKGNNCPTWEYLSSEQLPISNIYAAILHKDTSGNITFTYEKADVVLYTSHLASGGERVNGEDDKEYYIIGLNESSKQDPITVNKPEMGLFVISDSVSVIDANGKTHPYIYGYASSESSAFLKSSDAEIVKQILRTLKVNL